MTKLPLDWVYSVRIASGRQRGLTLIEMVVGVALVGVLAAVALPTYSSYRRRVHVAEGIASASGIQLRVGEEVLVSPNANVPQFKGPNAPQFSAPLMMPTIVAVSPSPMVQNIVRYGNTDLVINFNQRFDPQVTYALVMVGTPKGLTMSWTCLSGPAAQARLDMLGGMGGPMPGMPMPTEWAPPNCR